MRIPSNVQILDGVVEQVDLRASSYSQGTLIKPYGI